MTSAKCLKPLMRELRKLKLDLVHSEHGHIKVYQEDRYLISMPSTPSEGRGIINIRHQLRRLGVMVGKK